jgi:hypothetical protein
VTIWKRDYGIHDWLWVYYRSVEEWHSFRRRLTDAINRGGCDLRFVARDWRGDDPEGCFGDLRAWIERRMKELDVSQFTLR